MFSPLKSFIQYVVALIIIILIAILASGYFENHIDTITQFDQNILHNVTQTAHSIIGTVVIPGPPAAPCSMPIMYSLGTFDSGFGLTKMQFLDDINQAVQIWDKPFGKTFFELASSSGSGANAAANINGYDAASDLKINLIYDYRQQATDAMNAVGSSIDDETSVYNALKAKYNSLSVAYTQEKAALATVVADFQTEQNNYNQTVNYWNGRGGAPAAEYATLTQEKSTLESQAAAVTGDQDALNGTVNTINSTAATINKYVALLNSEATQYNSIASTSGTGEEFDEGEYVVDATSGDGATANKHIDIFQYSTQTKLIRVLAHELGHALGLGHTTSNPQAIMYPLNQGTNLSLAPEDVAAVKEECGIQ
jgi:hypothetical protein